MRYLCLYKSVETGPPTQAEMESMGALIQEWTSAGTLLAAEGAPVVASENGIVVFAGDEIPGYGRMLLISHADGFMTAYAHNREILVGVGELVERGQPVATVGRTGNVGSPQLHFELRDGKEPIDPVDLLDAARTQVASVR